MGRKAKGLITSQPVANVSRYNYRIFSGNERSGFLLGESQMKKLIKSIMSVVVVSLAFCVTANATPSAKIFCPGEFGYVKANGDVFAPSGHIYVDGRKSTTDDGAKIVAYKWTTAYHPLTDVLVETIEPGLLIVNLRPYVRGIQNKDTIFMQLVAVDENGEESLQTLLHIYLDENGFYIAPTYDELDLTPEPIEDPIVEIDPIDNIVDIEAPGLAWDATISKLKIQHNLKNETGTIQLHVNYALDGIVDFEGGDAEVKVIIVQNGVETEISGTLILDEKLNKNIHKWDLTKKAPKPDKPKNNKK